MNAPSNTSVVPGTTLSRVVCMPVVCLHLALALLATSTIPAWAQSSDADHRFVPGEVILQFVPEADEDQVVDALRLGRMELKRVIMTPVMRAQNHPGVNVVTTRLRVEEAVRALALHPAVSFAEPNWIYRHQAIPSDPDYASQWGLNGAYGINAEAAWDVSIGSSSVSVGIVDQGLDFNHVDLRDNIWLNPGDNTENGVNEDGNWYWYTYFFGWTVPVDCTDDLHGWDFLNQNNTLYDSFDSPTDLSDGDDHGSHVAGILGARGNNGLGVVGVNWDVSIITSKFIGGGIGTLEDALDAIDYMTFLKTRGIHAANLVAVNASWGGGGYSQAMHDALIRLANAGILFVAAAGNGGPDQIADDNDRMPFYPANYDTSQGTSTQPAASFNAVISVAALGSDGQLPPWSNYGLNTVHLAAPGVGIRSTVPTDLYSSGYEYFSGTSMATPHVTGAAALFLSAYPGSTAPQIREAILASVAPTPSLEGKTATGGRLDLAALLGSGSVPPPPPPVAATLHVGSITVTTLNVGRGQKKGRAEVLILDETGNPVANALVSGSFAGSLNESASKATSSAGLAILETTGTAKGSVIITFCVDSVAHPDLQYDPSSNFETCD